jgi:hypothetical protein
VRARGGFLLYEDAGRDLNFSTFAVNESGQPTAPLETGDRLMTATWYGREPYLGRVRVDLAPGAVFPLRAPFAQDAATCNFCTVVSGLGRGAIVFQPDGGVRFVDATGTSNTSLPVGVVALSGGDTTARGALAVAPSTGFMRVVRP